MSERIVQFNEDVIKGQIKELVRGSVEEDQVQLSSQFRNGYRKAIGTPVK